MSKELASSITKAKPWNNHILLSLSWKCLQICWFFYMHFEQIKYQMYWKNECQIAISFHPKILTILTLTINEQMNESHAWGCMETDEKGYGMPSTAPVPLLILLVLTLLHFSFCIFLFILILLLFLCFGRGFASCLPPAPLFFSTLIITVLLITFLLRGCSSSSRCCLSFPLVFILLILVAVYGLGPLPPTSTPRCLILIFILILFFFNCLLGLALWFSSSVLNPFSPGLIWRKNTVMKKKNAQTCNL